MGFALGSLARNSGYRLAAFETIGSTNAEAMARARAGETGPVWIVSREQTQGRGRRGRRWQTPCGNLGASCLVTLDARSIRHSATLGFVAGLALHEALQDLVPGAQLRPGLDGAGGEGFRFTLKWPNDVLADGAKLAGILLESERLDDRVVVVVGIGVNVVAAPEGLPYPATSLAALGVDLTAEEVFSRLSDAWVGYEGLWDEGRGLDAIRRLWLGHAAGLGAPVALKIGEKVLRGTFESIDEDGRLVVRRIDGAAEAVSAGDVHFGTVASAGAVS